MTAVEQGRCPSVDMFFAELRKADVGIVNRFLGRCALEAQSLRNGEQRELYRQIILSSWGMTDLSDLAEFDGVAANQISASFLNAEDYYDVCRYAAALVAIASHNTEKHSELNAALGRLWKRWREA